MGRYNPVNGLAPQHNDHVHPKSSKNRRGSPNYRKSTNFIPFDGSFNWLSNFYLVQLDWTNRSASNQKNVMVTSEDH